MGRTAPLMLGAAAPGQSIPGDTYQEGYYRVVLDWTPQDIRAAVMASSTGYLMLPADLCTAMRGDDRLPAVLSSRVLAVQGAPLTFEAAASGRLRRRALKAAQAEEDFWEMLPETELEDLLSWRRFLGVGLGELVWTETDPADPTGEAVIARIRNGRNVPRLKTWDPRHLRRDMQTGRWYVRTRDGSEVEARPGDGKWVLLTSGGSRPWLRAPWRGVAPLWLAKLYAREDWARQSERYADGSIYVESPDGTDQEERNLLASDINAAGKRPVIVLPSGFKASIMEIKAGAWDTYQAQWDKADRGMAVAILNNDLGTESRASAGVGAKLQGDVREDVKKADAKSDVTELRSQVLCAWAKANFGDPELAPWPVYAVDQSEDYASMASTWKTLFDAIRIAHENNIPVNVPEALAHFGVPSVATLGEQLPPLYAYDYAAGIPTVNEARARKGLASVSWGNVPTSTAPQGSAPTASTPAGSAPVANDTARATITGQVAALVGKTGDLRAALAEVSAEHGAPLTASELHALARLSVPAAARQLEQLFTGQAAARERSVARSIASAARRHPHLEGMAA